MILEVKNISKYFAIERGVFKKQSGIIRALDDVGFCVNEFDILGIVGESGSGKTTLAKIILKLIVPIRGEVLFDHHLIRNFRKDVQMIFQNPYSSLNPKMRIRDVISEPLLIHGLISRYNASRRATELLKTVGIQEDALERYPIEFSGGQRQRICIARALASEPKFIVLDEPVSSLDLTVQSEMLDLFLDLKQRFGLTYIFISHNLAVVKYLANRVIVMQDGRVVEEGEAAKIFSHPISPYTKLLLDAARG
jgi:ABC-type oligopeptide transport system ATPase subunit